MARKLQVEILGNSADLERAFSKAGRSAQGFNRNMQLTGRGVLSASGGFGALAKSALGATAIVGAAGFALKGSIDAAVESEKVQAQLSNALERQGISFAKNRAAIESRTRSLSLMAGVDDELLTETFTQFVRRTEDVTEALRLNALAVDVARGRSISLQAAANLVTKASLGQAGALRRVGIAAEQGANSTELLDLLQRKFAGSAEAYGKTAAGAQERFRVALENTQEIIGTALLPSLTRLLDKSAKWLADSENQARLQEAVNRSVDDGKSFVDRLADAWRAATGLVGDYRRELNKAPIPLGETVPEQINNFLNFAKRGRAELPGFVAQLLDIAAASERIASGFNAIEAARIGMLQGAPSQGIEDLRINPPAVTPDTTTTRRDRRRVTGRPLTEAERLRIALAGNPDDVSLLRQQRALFQRSLDFALKMIQERRGNTAKFAAAAEREAARIAAVNSRLAGITAENAARAQDAVDAAREKAEAARQSVIEMIGEGARGAAQVQNALERARRAFPQIAGVLSGTGRLTDVQRTAQQFAALGLGPTGDELAPTRKALIKEVGRIDAAIQGTFLDTGKTHSVIAGIRKALKLGLDGMADDVRTTVQRLLADLSGQLGDKGPLTKAAQASSRRLAQQLSAGVLLDAAALKQLRHNIVTANLSTVSPQVGAAGGVRLDIHNHNSIELDGRQVALSTVTHTSKAKRRSVTQTSGRNAGHPNRFG